MIKATAVVVVVIVVAVLRNSNHFQCQTAKR